jgi:tetratricopeptide (TPR) repeat protein
LHSLGRWQESVDTLSLAIDDSTQGLVARTYRADALRKLCRYSEAIFDCEEVIERDPGNLSARYTYGLTRYEESRSADDPSSKHALLEGAKKQLLTAKDIASKSKRLVVDVFRTLAAVERKLGNTTYAEHWLSEARNCTASSSLAHMACGVAD